MLSRFRRHKSLAAVLAAFVGLSACGPLCDPLSAFEKAASYDWMINYGRYSEPLNTWVRNDDLEAFLAKAVRSGGIAALRSQYGFQCTQRLVTPPCSDCYTCSRSLPKRPDIREGLHFSCGPLGEMLMQVDVGPGSTLTAMTYWQRGAGWPMR